ncbi:MAG: c-type cytochrome [Candidatus Hydrogenedentes bacterium]|nr:c-type cytochrome [Candidatus Hydrogenedentota bacterium]
MGICRLVAVFTAALSGLAYAQNDSLDRSYAEELPRIPATSPQDALKSFEIHPDFDIQLVAAEPLVLDPIAMAFDENGRLFVVEMSGYSELRDEVPGGIRMLEDTNGDGVYDQGTRYVDGLPWPTAVACYDGGLFVAAPPDIWYCKDTDGDGKADIKEIVFSGFSLTNVQGLLNSFNWGLDNQIHGATSSSGGTVTSVTKPEFPPVPLGGRDFAINPKTLQLSAESGGAQHGLSFDSWGRKLVCHNSDQLIQVMYEDRYLARNPYFSAPGVRVSIAEDGPTGDVFRISPIEPWRIVRTRLRVQGLVPGPVEGGGTPAGYFTSATGVTVYKGDAWPEAYRGNVFVADVGSNLVHRKTMEGDGIRILGKRADQNTEFLRSTDIWFRPVQFANAPDGNLYIADMSREVIEHPASLPPIIKQHLDLNSGSNQGRIYRIVPKGFNQPAPIRLGDLTSGELVDLLEHPNGWHRETASRLLYERQDTTVVPALEALAAQSASPVGRMHALYALDGLGALSQDMLLIALKDKDHHVRQHAVRLSEGMLASTAELAIAVSEMHDDPSENVRFQVAFSAGYLPVRADLLTTLLRNDGGNEWIRMAALSSAMDASALILAQLFEGGDLPGKGIVDALALQAGGFSEEETIQAMLEGPGFAHADAGVAESTVRGLLQGLKLSRRTAQARNIMARNAAAQQILDRSVVSAAGLLKSGGGKPEERTDAVLNLGFSEYQIAAPVLLPLLSGGDSVDVKKAVLIALAQYERPELAEAVVAAYPGQDPEVRDASLALLFARPLFLNVLLSAMESERFDVKQVDALRRAMLMQHADNAVREKAKAIFGQFPMSPRDTVVARYQPALTMTGDAVRGKALFSENCSQCHKAGDIGYLVGPDLSSFANRGAEQIVLNVLDPNRELNPQYLNHVIETTDWESYSGIIAAESANSITLRRGHGEETVILRVNVEAMKSSSLSLMPEGFEASITVEGMADLIAFLTSLVNL